MNTEAVMCMALTSASPSLTPLSRRHVSTCGVILMKARRPGTLNHSSLRKDFTVLLSPVASLPAARFREADALANRSRSSLQSPARALGEPSVQLTHVSAEQPGEVMAPAALV